MVPLVLLLAALVLSPIIGGGFGELTNGILQVLIFAAVCAHVVFNRHQKRMWNRAPGALLLGIFMLASLVSLVFTQDWYLGLKQTLFALACLAAFFTAAAVGRDARKATMLAAGLAVSALYICVTSIRYYIISTGGGAQFWAAVLGPGDHWRLFGTFINPNFFAGFLVMALPVSLALYLAARKSSLAVGFGLCFVMELAALAMTGSRFGMAAAAAALVIFLLLSIFTRNLAIPPLKPLLVMAVGFGFWIALQVAVLAMMGAWVVSVNAAAALAIFLLLSIFTRNVAILRWKRLLVIAIVIAPMMVVLSGTVRTRVEEGAAGGSQAHSGNFRVYTWKGTLRMIEANPIVGTGPGTYSIAFPRYALADWTSHAHQGYLQIAAENGLPALSALLLALIAIGTAGVKGALRRDDEPQECAGRPDALSWEDVVPPDGWRLVVCALIAAFAGSMIRNLVDSDWYVIGIALPFWVIAGLMVSRNGSPERNMKPPGWPVVALCAIAVALSVSFGLGDWFANVAPPRGENVSMYEMRRHYRQAVSVSPWNPEHHREYAKLLFAEGSIDDATYQIDRAIALAPRDADGYYIRGVFALRMEEWDQAVESFKAALALKPHSTQVLYALAISYHDLGRPADHEAALKRMLALEGTPYDTVTGVPEAVDTRYARAHFYFGQRDMAARKYVEASKEFQAAVDRLERWRSYPLYIEVAQAAGLSSKAEEDELIGLLRDSYRGLADCRGRN